MANDLTEKKEFNVSEVLNGTDLLKAEDIEFLKDDPGPVLFCKYRKRDSGFCNPLFHLKYQDVPADAFPRRTLN